MAEELPLIKRTQRRFYADSSKVIVRPFLPGPPERLRRICDRVLDMDETAATELYREVLARFAGRHEDLETFFESHYERLRENLPADKPLPPGRELSDTYRLLLGAYFSCEYAVQSAAFFNPSIVPHPDQSDVPDGGCRFVLSFRATGEGHLSSIMFRSGVMRADDSLVLEDASPYTATARVVADPAYDKYTFNLKLEELGHGGFVSRTILADLPQHFTLKQLDDAIWSFGEEYPDLAEHDVVYAIKWLARSNYQVHFSKYSDLSERILFPFSESEAKGLEDARFVLFTDDDGKRCYYATYSAYNGHNVLPQMIETRDFLQFSCLTLNGRMVTDKGMALFPRRVRGRYLMLGRHDGENLYVMDTNNLHFWNRAKPLDYPRSDWDLVQVGNCGSPIETGSGWLVLTHGVGPMREYCIGAMLLDLEDPTRVIGHLRRPLIRPNEEERNGYVPNVVYTCGAMAHNGRLLIPYAMSDSMSGIARVDLDELLTELTRT